MRGVLRMQEKFLKIGLFQGNERFMLLLYCSKGKAMHHPWYEEVHISNLLKQA